MKVKRERSRSVVSDSSRPHGLQPTRLLRPWDFPGKSIGVGCHCLLRALYWPATWTHLEAGPGLQWKTFSWIHQCSCSKDRTWSQCFYPRAWPLKWSKEIPGSFWPPYHHVIWMCSFLGLWLTACRIFVLQPGTEPRPVDVKAQSLIHWTAREFPLNVFWVTLS